MSRSPSSHRGARAERPAPAVRRRESEPDADPAARDELADPARALLLNASHVAVVGLAVALIGATLLGDTGPKRIAALVGVALVNAVAVGKNLTGRHALAATNPDAADRAYAAVRTKVVWFAVFVSFAIVVFGAHLHDSPPHRPHRPHREPPRSPIFDLDARAKDPEIARLIDDMGERISDRTIAWLRNPESVLVEDGGTRPTVDELDAHWQRLLGAPLEERHATALSFDSLLWVERLLERRATSVPPQREERYVESVSVSDPEGQGAKVTVPVIVQDGRPLYRLPELPGTDR